MRPIFDWLDDRTGYRAFVRDALYERVPGGARWRYVWGSTLVFAFVVQLVTGFFLWTAYSPNSQGAWESVYYIQYAMQGGWLLRGIHHFMAHAMVVLLALHLMQVVIDGAYRAPREVNFWLGLVLMLIVLGLSLTGYLLPWDQKGFWATKVATNIMAITPVVGPALQRIVVGGSEYGHHTLTRFFALHAGLLPALLVGFLVVHISVFRRHGIHARKPVSRGDSMFWPDQILRDAVACLGVLAVVLLLVFLPAFQGAPVGPELGAELGAPADRTENYSAARPEWYYLFLYQLLKYFPGESEVIGSHLIPGAVLLLMFLMPLIGKWKLGHRFNVGFVFCLLIGIAALTGLAIREDQNNESYLAAKEEAEHAAHRVPELVQAKGIGTAGAVELVRNDPYLQGPKLFAKNCASCHRYNGHDGTGRKVMERIDGELVEAKPTAADLGNFGSREWMRSLLLDYSNHFAPLKNAAWYKELKQAEEKGEDVSGKLLDIDNSEMADWSRTHAKVLSKDENQESVAALIEFLVAQSGREDLGVDAELAAKGRDVATEGTLAAGEMAACIDCHDTLGDTFEATGFGLGYPDLAGYGSAAWLKNFIENPGTDQHYGSKNHMPAFKDQLSDRELDLLVRWMVRDYYPPKREGFPGDDSASF